MHRFISSHSPGLFLLLLSICVAFGVSAGCRTTDDREVFREALHANIHDDDRRTQIQEVFDRRSDTMDEFLQEVDVLRDRLQNTIADLGTRSGDSAPVLEEFDRAWIEMRDEVINGSLELRSLMSAEEWAVLSDLDADTIISRSVTPQQP